MSPHRKHSDTTWGDLMDDLQVVRDYCKATGREVMLRVGPHGELSGYDRIPSANIAFGFGEMQAMSVEEMITTFCVRERVRLAEIVESQTTARKEREAIVDKLPL
jgi:hypothetical protein